MNIFEQLKKRIGQKPQLDTDDALAKKMQPSWINPLSKKMEDKLKNIETKQVKGVKPAKEKKRYSRFDKKKVAKRKIVPIMNEFLAKIGYEGTARELNKKIFLFDLKLLGGFSIIFLFIAIRNALFMDVVITWLLIIWTVLFAALYLASILFFMLYLDVQMFQRTKQIEEALPDYLQLTAANISAGMTIDRALWYAVRPKFGVLAVEMENVAKSTLTGEELEVALLKFSKKYDSRMLHESINLIIAGLKSGGEMAVLLSKISQNIKEASLIKKEIAASVMTYVIFIVSATIIAAPVLFALSTELLTVIKQITSRIHLDNTAGVSGLFSFNFSGDSISIDSFKRFSLLVLVISSSFTAMITSTIRKGTVKDGMRYIPIFIAVSVIIYLIFTTVFGSLLGGIFGS